VLRGSSLLFRLRVYLRGFNGILVAAPGEGEELSLAGSVA